MEWPFRSTAPKRIWVGDITQISTREGILHLAAIQDVYSRRIVGWSMSSQQRSKLRKMRLAWPWCATHQHPA
ncbi:DDE-type integrase/transposase/recombinase [Stenotrophomonas humi]